MRSEADANPEGAVDAGGVRFLVEVVVRGNVAARDATHRRHQLHEAEVRDEIEEDVGARDIERIAHGATLEASQRLIHRVEGAGFGLVPILTYPNGEAEREQRLARDHAP